MYKLLLLLFVCFNFSVINAEEIDKNKFKSLIVGYNHGIIKAAQKNKFEHLKEYLTEEIFYKTLVWIESYQDSNLFMDAILLNLDFKKFEKDIYTASIETSELWKYRYINTKTKEVIKKPTKTEYKLKYFFILQKDGKWKINHIKIIEEKNTPIQEGN